MLTVHSLRTYFIRIISFIISLLHSPGLSAQISFEKFFPGTYNVNHSVYSVLQTSDSGYAMAIGDIFPGYALYRYSIVKTDSLGKTEWERSSMLDYSFYSAHASAIKKTANGGYIITGYSNNTGRTNFDVFLIKTDDLGQVIWKQTYDSLESLVSPYGSHQEGHDVIQTSDGGYLITGKTGLPNELFLLKVDVAGNEMWLQKDTGIGHAYGESLQDVEQGNYLVFGSTSIDGSDRLMYLLKTDSGGSIIWRKTYKWNKGDYALGWSVKTNRNGEYILCGYGKDSVTMGFEMLLTVTDTAGNMLWQKSYLKDDHSFAQDVDTTYDGGYIMAGASQSANGTAVYVIKTDAAGGKIWERNFGTNFSYDAANSIKQTLDGGYIIGGLRQFDGYLIKTDSAGNILTGINDENNFSPKIMMLANPVSDGQIRIAVNLRETVSVDFKLFDLMGRKIREQQSVNYQGLSTITFDVHDINCGVYILNLNAGKNSYSLKVIINSSIYE